MWVTHKHSRHRLTHISTRVLLLSFSLRSPPPLPRLSNVQAPASDCSGTTNDKSPTYAHTGVCVRMSKTSSMMAKAVGSDLHFDVWSSTATCTGAATGTLNFGTIGSCNQITGTTGEAFLVTEKPESQVVFEDIAVEITGAWLSGDCTGTAIPIAPADAVSAPGECTDTFEDYGDKSKTAKLVGDPGYFYEVVYHSASADKKCVGDYASTNRYKFDTCQKIEVENSDGSKTAVSFKFKEAEMSSAATTTASLAVVLAAVGTAAALLL